MTKTTVASLGIVERLNLLENGCLMLSNNHLADAVAVVDCERCVGKIDEYGANLATIVGVDGAGRIEDGNSTLGGKSAPWTYLSLVAYGQLDENACGDNSTAERWDCDIFREIGP